jgi:hypothetical protein
LAMICSPLLCVWISGSRVGGRRGQAVCFRNRYPAVYVSVLNDFRRTRWREHARSRMSV